MSLLHNTAHHWGQGQQCSFPLAHLSDTRPHRTRVKLSPQTRKRVKFPAIQTQNSILKCSALTALISDLTLIRSGLWWEDLTPQFDPLTVIPRTIRAIKQNEEHTLSRQGMWVTLHLHVRSKPAAPSACGSREGRFQQQQDGNAGLPFHHKNYFCNSIFRNCILGGCCSLPGKEGKGMWQEPSKPTHMLKGRELQSVALMLNGNSKPPAASPCQKLAGTCCKHEPLWLAVRLERWWSYKASRDSRTRIYVISLPSLGLSLLKSPKEVN